MTRADSRLAPSQWETSSQSNTVSHWLGTNLDSCRIKAGQIHCFGALPTWGKLSAMRQWPCCWICDYCHIIIHNVPTCIKAIKQILDKSGQEPYNPLVSLLQAGLSSLSDSALWGQPLIWSVTSTYCGLVMPDCDTDLGQHWVNSLPDGTKPWPAPILTNHQLGHILQEMHNHKIIMWDIYTRYEVDHS